MNRRNWPPADEAVDRAVVAEDRVGVARVAVRGRVPEVVDARAACRRRRRSCRRRPAACSACGEVEVRAAADQVVLAEAAEDQVVAAAALDVVVAVGRRARRTRPAPPRCRRRSRSSRRPGSCRCRSGRRSRRRPRRRRSCRRRTGARCVFAVVEEHDAAARATPSGLICGGADVRDRRRRPSSRCRSSPRSGSGSRRLSRLAAEDRRVVACRRRRCRRRRRSCRRRRGRARRCGRRSGRRRRRRPRSCRRPAGRARCRCRRRR